MYHAPSLTVFLRSALLAFSAFAASGTATAQDIVLGQIAPFTNIPVKEASELNHGMTAYINEVNKHGGIRGRKVTLFDLDDRYTPEGFVEQWGKAMERKPIALLSPIGSSALSRMLKDKMLDQNDVVMVNAIPGAEVLRNPGHARFFHVRAGDKQQIEKIVTHANTIGMKKISVLYQDLPVGTSAWAVAEATAKANGMQIKGIKAATELPAVEAAAKELAATEPQGVLVLGAPRFMADGIVAVRKAGVSQMIFVLSYVPAGLVVKLAGPEAARGVGIAQTFPNPNGVSMPLQREFHAAMKASHPDLKAYTSFNLEGYLTARIVLDALKRSKDKDITAATLEKALHTAGEMDFGGFRVNFADGQIGSKWVDIAVIGQEGKLRY
jgi:branched-chain amino acid transport system substrate-binding protein